MTLAASPTLVCMDAPSNPRITVPFLRLVVAIGLALALHGGEGAGLVNPGFEGEFAALPAAPAEAGAQITGAIAAGWEDNSSWAKVQVAYAPETADPHSGASAQSVRIGRIDSGMVQLVQPVRFTAGTGVRFSVWLRGRPGQSVSLLLRQATAPWKGYATSIANLSPEWREYRVQGVTPKDEPGLLMIQAGSTLAFQIDDARFDVLRDLSADAPPKPGNLITGGSFETVTPPFGWTTRRQGDVAWDWSDHPQITDGGGAVGQRCLRVDFHANTGFSEIRSPVFVPNGDRLHTASVWLKSSMDKTHVRIGFDNTKLLTSVMVGTTWQRFTFSETLPFLEFSRLRLSLYDPKGPFTLWVDGAMVEERSEPSEGYLAAAPVDVTLRCDRPGHILHDGGRAEAAVEVAPEPPAGATLDLSVEDLFGGTTRLPALALPVASIPLPELPERPRGMFKLRAVVRGADGAILSAPTELVWARLPKPRELKPTDSYFGVHIPMAPAYIAMARAAGLRWVRFHDGSSIGKWPVAEPQQGRWEYYDTQVDAAHQAGLAMLGMLDGAPEWVASRKRTGYFGYWHIPDKPGAVEHWRTYVRNVVGHYKGRIDHWELWNEPWGPWWREAGGSTELFAELMKTAYSEAKLANPGATIIGINTMRGNDWTGKILALTGTDCFDAFSYHDYNNALYTTAFAQKQVDTFTAAMAKVGTPKPQWNTEGGLPGVGSWYAPMAGGMAPRVQVSYAIRFDVCSLAAGVRAFMMYGIHSNGSMGQIEYRCDEFDRAIKPVIAGRSVLASLVDGIGRPTHRTPSAGMACYDFPVADGRQVSVWWAMDDAVHDVPVPAGTQALDALGSPKPSNGGVVQIDTEPVYLITPAAP